MPKIHAIDRAGVEHVIDADPDLTLMENLIDFDGGRLEVAAVCGGCLSCATCHVFVDEAWADKLDERSEDETFLLEDSGHFDDRRSRLSCQIELSDALDGLKVTVAPED